MAPSTPPGLTDDELAVLVDRLNRFEPADLHDALSSIDAGVVEGRAGGRSDVEARRLSAPGEAAPGTVGLENVAASGPLNFGATPPGVLVGRLEGGRFRVRLTRAEMTGAAYDEFVLSADALRRLVDALVATLRARHASEGP